jgi:SAM-dependent methyltransferase
MLRQIANLSQRLGLLPVAYRVYERFKALDPRVAERNQRHVQHPEALEFPLPPAEMMVQVAGTADAHWFLLFGQSMAELIQAMLAKQGYAFNQAQAVLEFGCGCGRVLRHFGQTAGPQFYGCDYNPRLLEWSQSHLPFAQFAINRAMPPLSYADAQFDVIYSISVFTHLAEDAQRPWIVELARAVRPGGYVFITTMGESFLGQLAPHEQAAFRAGQLVVQYAEVSGLNLCGAYHPRAYVQNTLAQEFDMVDFLPSGSRDFLFQDVYLLRKRDVDKS